MPVHGQPRGQSCTGRGMGFALVGSSPGVRMSEPVAFGIVMFGGMALLALWYLKGTLRRTDDGRLHTALGRLRLRMKDWFRS